MHESIAGYGISCTGTINMPPASTDFILQDVFCADGGNVGKINGPVQMHIQFPWSVDSRHYSEQKEGTKHLMY